MQKIRRGDEVEVISGRNKGQRGKVRINMVDDGKVVVEGVEGFPTGGAHANVINAVQSWDGGRTWDDALRRTVYQARIDPGSGRRYNAYVPSAIRVNNGPVGVEFCTDEDKAGPPDASSAPVAQRNCHVGYVSTTTNFETWSGASRSRSAVSVAASCARRLSSARRGPNRAGAVS